MSKALFSIATSPLQAENIVAELKQAGFSYDDISVLFPDQAGSKHFAHEHHTKAPEGIAAGAGTGGVVGGAFGLLAGLGALAAPGFGLLVAAGPLMSALSGAAAGAVIGGIAGALIGFGIPEREAKRYQGRIQTGNILISVHCETPAELELAREIFERAGAEDIASGQEVAAGSETPGGPW